MIYLSLVFINKIKCVYLLGITKELDLKDFWNHIQRLLICSTVFYWKLRVQFAKLTAFVNFKWDTNVQMNIFRKIVAEIGICLIFGLIFNIKSNKNQLNDITIAFIHTMYMYMLTLDRINLHTDEKWLQNIVINFWIQQKLLIFCYSFQELIGRFCRWNWNWYPIYKGIDSIFFTKLCLI